MAEVIILLGAPGAGKGTQAELLAAELSYCRLSTGDILREEARAGSPLGRKARAYMQEGTLVPDDLILQMVEEWLDKPVCQGGAVLDGFPRSFGQVRGLDEMIGRRGDRLRGVLFLEVSRERLVARISGRRVCTGCGALCNVKLEEGGETCRSCGGDLVQREDDRPETVARRLQVFDEETAPLRAHYEEEGQLTLVDGEGQPEEVHERILSVLAVEQERLS